MKKILILVLIFFLLASFVLAEQGHMVLLAVSESEGHYKGSAADLYLEIEPGKGRVFIDSYPLTKLDTQISTRFAKEIVCSFLNVDCSRYDFFYTIKADSPIVGGPSAGAAMSVLTASLLDNLRLDSNVAITGTINSGYLVGPVGGLKEKIDMASKLKIKKVLIPSGSRFLKENNKTTDLFEYGKNLSVDVVEADSLNSAIFEFTGKRYYELDEKNIKISEKYSQIMKNISSQLCQRSNELLYVKDLGNISEALDLISKSKNASLSESYYSAASYCFGANVKLNSIKLQNISTKKVLQLSVSLAGNIKQFNDLLEKRKYTTILDLETYMIVKERLMEAKETLKELDKLNGTAKTDNLAYALERYRSALSWSNFFDVGGRRFDLSEEKLKDSCINKISEAEERFQYAQLFFPGELNGIKKEKIMAQENLDNKRYALCLFKASKAKAKADIILSVIGVDKENVKMVVDRKLDVTKRNIIDETKNGVFPMLSYSYYEYSQSLKKDDVYSALLYSEYALELSNLELYFKEKRKIKLYESNYKTIVIFITGALSGAALSGAFLIFLLQISPKQKKKKIKKDLRRKRKNKI